MPEPRDITDIVQRYRLALRDIWNSCFYVDPELRDWDAVESWRRLEVPLFNAVVADTLGIPDRETSLAPAFVSHRNLNRTG